MQFLGLVLQKQEQIMQVLGPVNPLAGIDKYRATLAQIHDAGRLQGRQPLLRPGHARVHAAAPAVRAEPAAEPANDARAGRSSRKAKVARAQVAKFQQEQLEASQKDQREREKLRMDALVKMAARSRRSTAANSMPA
jgi:hypothetical protein